jgi:hypothetical protein
MTKRQKLNELEKTLQKVRDKLAFMLREQAGQVADKTDITDLCMNEETQKTER